MARFDSSLELPDRPLAEYSDGELYRLWRDAGRLRKSSERVFLAMLPSILARGLHRQDFTSIGHAASVLGGISGEVVREVLELHRRIVPVAPRIWSFFEQGRTGWTLLKRIVGHLADEGEDYWLDLLQRGLSRRELGRILDEKRSRRQAARVRSGGRGPGNERPIAGASREKELSAGSGISGSERQAPWSNDLGAGEDPGLPELALISGNEPVDAPPNRPRVKLRFEVDALTAARFEGLRRAREAEQGCKFSAAEFLAWLVREAAGSGPGGKIAYREVVHTIEGSQQTFLAGPRGPIPLEAAELEKMERTEQVDAEARFLDAEEAGTQSRGEAVPPRVIEAVQLRSGGLCEARGCRERATCLHHREEPGREGPGGRRDHRLSNLAHLCDTCHGLLHLGQIANPQAPPREWQLRGPGQILPARTRPRDRRYQEKRRAARSYGTAWSEPAAVGGSG